MERKNRFVAMDFEYLYLAKYDTPCAVGLVKVIDNVATEKYYSLIYQPQMDIPLAPKNSITPEMVANAPHYEEVYARMVQFIGDLPIVAHNASVEHKVLEETPFPADMPCLADNDFIDTDSLSGHRSLKDLCEEFEIALNHHNALSDAEACAEVYLKLYGSGFVKEVIRTAPLSSAKMKMMTSDTKNPETFGSLPESEWVCTDSVLKGRHVCVSGEYSNFPDRGELRLALMRRGAIVDKSIVKATEILVSGSIKPAGPSKTKQILARDGVVLTEMEVILLLQ